jgi:hypothetical protein
MDDDPECIAALKRKIGGTLAHEVTDDMLIGEWLIMSPAQRATELETISQWVSHSGSPDRKTARLLDFDRKVRTIDRELRKCGR